MVMEGYISQIEKDGVGTCIWNYFEVAVFGRQARSQDRPEVQRHLIPLPKPRHRHRQGSALSVGCWGASIGGQTTRGLLALGAGVMYAGRGRGTYFRSVL